MYRLYTDKNENLECEVSVKNASLKDSVARLMVESEDGLIIAFNGTIKDGKCNVPIRRLKGLLPENSKGNMTLELIVEDTYFKPWKSEFTVEEHTSVKVKVNEQRSSSKPIVEVKMLKTPLLHTGACELAILCEKFNITRKNITSKASTRKDFKQVIKEYFSSNKEYNNNKDEIMEQLAVILK